MANQINTGWWIGYVEQKEKIYFALNLRALDINHQILPGQ